LSIIIFTGGLMKHTAWEYIEGILLIAMVVIAGLAIIYLDMVKL